LEGLDASGNVIFSLPFSGEELAEGDELPFGFTVPESRTTGLASLRVLRGNRILTQTAPNLHTLSVTSAPQATRLPNGDVEIRWDAAHYPTALLRDPQTGEVLAISREGVAVVTPEGNTLTLTLSDGVNSVTQTVTF